MISPVIMDNGYRQFSDADVSKLKRIAVLRGLGFSVSDIRTVLEKEGLPAIYDVLNKKELEIADLQTKQALIKQLADGGDWDHIRTQMDALQKKQSILTRILDKFPGCYGKFVCLHFAPFLGEMGVRTKSWTKQRPQGGSRYIVHIRKESPRPAII